MRRGGNLGPTSRHHGVIRVLQLSDPHLLADPRGLCRGRPALACLRHGWDQALRQQRQRPDLLLISGDLYHYPEERSLNRVPPRDFDPKQTAASRTALEAFLKQSGAQLWIQHDIAANAKLLKAPKFYE